MIFSPFYDLVRHFVDVYLDTQMSLPGNCRIQVVGFDYARLWERTQIGKSYTSQLAKFAIIHQKLYEPIRGSVL